MKAPGDEAPKVQLRMFSFPSVTNIVLVDDSEEEEQISEEKSVVDEPFMQPMRKRSSSITTFIFENKGSL